jgi:hypothetical protein
MSYDIWEKYGHYVWTYPGRRTQPHWHQDIKRARIQAHHIAKGHEKTWSVDDAQ